MSFDVTLGADITVSCGANKTRVTIPSGTVITFPDAVETSYAGTHNDGTNRNFATAACAAADMLTQVAGRAALTTNIAQFNSQVVGGVTYDVTFGPASQASFSSHLVSPSASPSASPSVSVSASFSASASASHSASISASPSVSVSASPSTSVSASLSASASSSLSASASSSLSASPSAS